MSDQQQNRFREWETYQADIMSRTDESEEEIDILELVYYLLSKWKPIVCMVLACTLLMGLYTFLIVTPEYEATSTIYVLNRSDSAVDLSDLQIGIALTQDYIKVFEMWEIHEEVISNLGLPYSYEEMERMLTVTNDDNTRMLDISVRTASPEEAAVLANEYAKVASEYIADTMATNKPNIMSVALVPVNPVSPNITLNLMIGILVGLVIGCGIFFIRFIMDDMYKTAEDIRRYTGLVTLAVVPVEPETPQNNRKGGRR